MKNLTLIPVLLFFLSQDLAAQNINGFQIFVSKKQFTSIEFHSAIDNIAFAQKNPPYKVVFMGAKTIFLETSQDVKAPYDLSIIEGGRIHKFVIIYADDVDQSKRDNDYSNLTQLRALIRNFVPASINSSAQNDSKKSTSQGASQRDSGARSSASPSNLNFYVLIDEADKARKAGQWQIAKNKYKQALQIQPDNSYAQTHLRAVDETIQNESETKYNDAIAKARQALAGNNYDDAIKIFSLALEAKPGDQYAVKQVAGLQKKAATAKIEKDNLQQEELFNSYIKAGDKAFADNDYEPATTAYGEALKIKPGDPVATAKLTWLNQKIEADSLAAVRLKADTAFTNLITAAKEGIDKKDYNAAIFFYTEALKIKPGDEYALSQVSKVQQAIIQSQADSIKQKEHEVAGGGVESDTTSLETLAVHEIEAGMLLIKARYFKMGSDVGSTDESPMHTVKLDSFYISRFEVTQSQWQSIMGNNPSFFKGCDDCPVENVSWYDAMKFIDRLSQITRKKYRLPTEAEWEYVAGTQNRKDDIDNIAWYNDNAKNRTHHIGVLQPDFLGVYDMFGNVAEWCNDWYSYSTYKKNSATNPLGPATGKEKVVRGGDWYDMGGSFRPSVRDKASPDKASKKTGFRLAMSLEQYD
ncbi:MAG TPA: SUMF1/EgtB/PvdO family nonheme iron enzyme [Parafilimonas sp.]|nr:SUMF1/EgtB/PvdO family nonheme iron enzyme [Parafilimonas sp.]